MRLIALGLGFAILPAGAAAQDPIMAGQGAVLDSMNYNNTRNSYRRAGNSDAEFKRDMRRAYARRDRRAGDRLTPAERYVRDNPDPEMRRLCAKASTMRLKPSGRRTYEKYCLR